MDSWTRRGRGTRLLITAAVAAGIAAPAVIASTPAAAATVAVPGMTVTTNIQSNGRGSVAIVLTTARSLAVTCNGGVNVNGVQVKVPCMNLIDLDITGSPGNDTIDVEGTGFQALAVPGFDAVLVTMHLGAGNDVAAVRMRTSSIDIWGGTGDDRLSSASYPNGASGFATAGLYGEDGNDRLTNAGFLTGTKPDPTNVIASNPYAVLMKGGPGADVVTGSNDRVDQVDLDTADSVALGSGVALVTVNLTQQTNVVSLDANGNYGPKLSVTTSGKAWKLNLPTLTQALQLNTLGGPDQITVLGKSVRTPISIDTGSGADILTIRPWSGYRWDKAKGIVTQPGANDISYNPSRTSTTVKVAAR